jgi:hypothetical protein
MIPPSQQYKQVDCRKDQEEMREKKKLEKCFAFRSALISCCRARIFILLQLVSFEIYAKDVFLPSADFEGLETTPPTPPLNLIEIGY